MKNVLISLRILVFFTVVCGLAYPLLITGVAQTLFREKASGQLVEVNGQIVGSLLIAQKFTKPEYFWPRPSAIDYNPLPSGGSNLGPTSAALKEILQSRKDQWQIANPDAAVIPNEMLFASASGLDPHISPMAAKAQIQRVSRLRSVSESDLTALIDQHTVRRTWNLLGEATVNILALNKALDTMTAD